MNIKSITRRGLVLIGLAIALAQTVTAQTNYYWQTIAYNPTTLPAPEGLGVDALGNVYVADPSANVIDEASPSGTNWTVTVIAGHAGGSGTNDGVGTSAKFNQPNDVAVENPTTLFVADTENNTIREVHFNGTAWNVTTIAGDASQGGNYVDGTNLFALFQGPTGIAVDQHGNLYVADQNNQVIREITPSGTNWITATIAGTAGNESWNDGTNGDAAFAAPSGIAVNSSGDLFVADYDDYTIREITPIGTNWVTTTISGTDGNLSFIDGTNGVAAFQGPFGVAVDSMNNVFVTDPFNNAIRKVSPSGTNWITTTIGGEAGPGDSASNGGLLDGTNIVAQFNFPNGVAVDLGGNVYVGDTGNSAIRVGYLFPPSLTFLLAGNQATLSYPPALGTNFGFVLQSATNLQSPIWVDVTNQWQFATNLYSTNQVPFVNLTVTNTIPKQFFRLGLP